MTGSTPSAVTGSAAGTGAGTVLVTSRSFSSGALDLEARLRAAGLEPVRGATDHDPLALAPLLAGAVGWVAGTAPVTAAHLALAPRLRVLARHGTGTDAVDLDAAARAGVVVTNTPGANAEAVAEHALALLLAALRGVAAGDRRVRGGDWSVGPAARRGRQLDGAVAGVVGFGRIGRGLARRLLALGCRVLVADPWVDDDAVRAAGAEPADLATLRRTAEVVSLHAPGGRVLVDAAWVADCAAGQVLVNTARADLLDEAAVAAALRDGRLGSLAADTLADETGPQAPGDPSGTGTDAGRAGSPLLAADLADRVVVTPHLGAQTTGAVDLMGAGAVEAVLAVLAGRTPAHVVAGGAA